MKHWASTYKSDNLTHNDGNLTHNDANLMNNDSRRDQFGRLVSKHLDKPFIDELDQLEDTFKQSLLLMGETARIQKRLLPGNMKVLIQKITLFFARQCADPRGKFHLCNTEQRLS